MSLADYLAKNYLNAVSTSSPKSKKRKRRTQTHSSSLFIEDDDTSIKRFTQSKVEDLNRPTLAAGQISEFRKTRNDNWTSVGTFAPTSIEQIAAEAIIASASEEKKMHDLAETEFPQIVAEISNNVIKMESGARAGLQSAEQIKEDLERQKQEERRHSEIEDAQNSKNTNETIYRDASGRVVNVAMKRAEARRKAEEEEERRLNELEASKGDVQRQQRKDREQKLADAKYLTFARYADDTEFNEEMKQQDRWNDPAMNFLAQKDHKKSNSGKPLYKGFVPQNRYGIRPGYRWDGVDRSNGFEKDYFTAINHRQANKNLEYAWQIDE